MTTFGCEVSSKRESEQSRAKRTLPRGAKNALIDLKHKQQPTNKQIISWLLERDMIKQRIDGNGYTLTTFGRKTADDFDKLGRI